MELLHYSFQFHNPTIQFNSINLEQEPEPEPEPVFLIHFHSQFFIRLVHPRPDLVPTTSSSAVLRLVRRSGMGSIGAMLTRLGVSENLAQFLEPEIFRTVLGVSCGASNVGFLGVGIWAATLYDDVEEIDRALREVGAGGLGIEGLERVRVRVGGGGGEECAICLGDLGFGVAVKLPCKHVYHEDCIVKWSRHKNVCPLCRSSICLNVS